MPQRPQRSQAATHPDPPGPQGAPPQAVGRHHNDRRRCQHADAAGWITDWKPDEQVATAGARSGVWAWLPGRLGPESVVYSGGVGDNAAWDLELIARHGLTVHGFDPTEMSIQWELQQRRAGSLPKGFVFHPVGLAGHDGEIQLVPPRPGKVNHRLWDGGAGDGRGSVTVPVRRVRTLMAQLGHSQIDLFKLDIEGAEFAVLDDMLDCGILPGQLLVEFHEGPRPRRWWGARRNPGVWWPRIGHAMQRLRAAGYRIHWRSPRGLEFAMGRPTD